MSQYTEFLNIKAETLSYEDDDYEEKLLEVASTFCGFDEALTAFIEEHGYVGDLTDISAKTQFLREKFKMANVKPPRDFKEWFMPNKKFSRKTAFRICFALNLSVDETKDFFRRVQFERAFDCHTVVEAVYYFCIKNGFSYSEAQEIIDSIPIPQKVKTIPNLEVLYTGTVIEYINSINDKEKLIQYIKDNIDDFRYNNVTAIKYIQELWYEISKKGGLASQEGSLINSARNREEDKSKKGIDTRFAEVIKAEINYQKKIVKQDDHVIAGSNASTWTIFSQIIGLTNAQENKYAIKYDRSLSTVLSKNKLMPLRADYCFPSRQNIDKLIRGDLVGDSEIIRKMLIFLIFYTYWVKIVISKNDVDYSIKLSDSKRCFATINNRLLDAGYPELYVGNPYDWLFIWASYDDNPLNAFRYYMGEVFTSNEEDSKD